MTLYQACNVLWIWPIAKVWAEVWAGSRRTNKESVNNVVVSAKKNFKELAMKHHPDKGGDQNEYINIQDAFNLIKDATIEDFICSLREELREQKNTIVCFKRTNV